WDKTNGASDISVWRSMPGHADIADTLLSDFIDEHFRGQAPTWQEGAERLGFKLLKNHGGNDRGQFLGFFEMVKKNGVRKTDGRWAKRWPGHYVIDKWRDVEAELHTLFRELTDSGNDLQKITGHNWTETTGLAGLDCKVEVHHGQAGVFFHVGGTAWDGISQ